ncbi:glycosyltransferase family 61 protein [Candidatus Dependentiae bacterium]|nr:glycosyltransferase family 61 protein [Candidatus Dependentiae bacterium]
MKQINIYFFLFVFLIFNNFFYLLTQDSDSNQKDSDWKENQITLYIKSLEQVLKENPSIKCLHCLGKFPYDFPPFLEPKYPNKGIFEECFILSIPQGKVQGFSGNVLIGDSIIKEMIWAQDINSLKDLVVVPENSIINLPYKVAVIVQNASYNYCHFLHEVLGRLALLEMYNIEYDYILVPYHKPFMRELLNLWGIDSNKIIFINDNNACIQANELILPSLLLNTDVGFAHAGFHPHPKTSLYVKEKLSKALNSLNLDTQKFSKKVFISRQDAPQRKIINENEIFALFEPYGFVRYEMSKLSVLDQIVIMQNADIVVGEHGAGLTNILFCKSGTLVIELFQKLIDSGYWWASNLIGLKYIPINTLKQDTSWAVDWRLYGNKYSQAWASKTNVSMDEIRTVIEKYFE